MSDQTRREKGLAAFERVMTFAPPEMQDNPFLDTTIDHLFADVWARPGLGIRERRLITLTTLICLGHEGNLKLHLRAAVGSGDLTDAEIDELILHAAHYAGWPAASVAVQVIGQLRAERTRDA